MNKLSKKTNRLVPYMTVFQLRRALDYLEDDDELTLITRTVENQVGHDLAVVSKDGHYKGVIDFGDSRFYDAHVPKARG